MSSVRVIKVPDSPEPKASCLCCSSKNMSEELKKARDEFKEKQKELKLQKDHEKEEKKIKREQERAERQKQKAEETAETRKQARKERKQKRALPKDPAPPSSNNSSSGSDSETKLEKPKRSNMKNDTIKVTPTNQEYEMNEKGKFRMTGFCPDCKSKLSVFVSLEDVPEFVFKQINLDKAKMIEEYKQKKLSKSKNKRQKTSSESSS